MRDEPIRPGYKRTEVGVIPEDWTTDSLGELCNFENGDRGKNYPSRQTLVLDGVPFINAGHVSRGRIDLSEMDYISRANFERLRGGKVMPGDILFCLRGSLGKYGVVEENFGEGAIASSLVIVRPKYARIVREYLTHYFGSIYCAQMIEKWAGGAAQPNLGARDLSRFIIALPPTVAEQTAIAEVLSDVDALLDALERLIAKKRAIKQGAMQALLTGRVRLPGFRDEWNRTTLGEIALITMGQSPDSRNYNVEGRGIPLVQGNADIKNRRSIRRVWTTQITKACDKGDLLLTVRAPVGIVGRASEYSCLGRGVCALKPNGVDGDFLYHVLIFAESQWEIVEQGSTFTSANSTQISAFTLAIPISLEEQTAIAEVLSDMDAEIETLERRRAKVRAIKQGMMQELLTGRVRLVGPNAEQ